MLAKIFAPFTSATGTGVTIRDVTMLIGSLLAILGILGILSPDQVDAIKKQVEVLTDPKLLTALGFAITAGVSIYRNITKSSSDKAAAVAKEVDAGVKDGVLLKSAPVVIKTPGKSEDIVVQPPVK